VKPLLANRGLRLFPCCVCGEGREVRTTKKGKPYLICDLCGVQMFVRVETGIRRFEQLVGGCHRNDIWKRLAELQQRYQPQCHGAARSLVNATIDCDELGQWQVGRLSVSRFRMWRNRQTGGCMKTHIVGIGRNPRSGSADGLYHNPPVGQRAEK